MPAAVALVRRTGTGAASLQRQGSKQARGPWHLPPVKSSMSCVCRRVAPPGSKRRAVRFLFRQHSWAVGSGSRTRPAPTTTGGKARKRTLGLDCVLIKLAGLSSIFAIQPNPDVDEARELGPQSATFGREDNSHLTALASPCYEWNTDRGRTEPARRGAGDHAQNSGVNIWPCHSSG